MNKVSKTRTKASGNSEKTCFVIAPIGEEGSETRKRSDDIFDCIIQPVMQKCEYKAIRADHIKTPGMITIDVIRAVIEADIVLADMSGQNPNVFYELAIRHGFNKPCIHIINKEGKIPFDLIDLRTIRIDDGIRGPQMAQDAIEKQIQAIENGKEKEGFYNPINMSFDLIKLGKSTDENEKVKELINMVVHLNSDVGNRLDRIERHIRRLDRSNRLERFERAEAERAMDIRRRRLRHLMDDDLDLDNIDNRRKLRRLMNTNYELDLGNEDNELEFDL